MKFKTIIILTILTVLGVTGFSFFNAFQTVKKVEPEKISELNSLLSGDTTWIDLVSKKMSSSSVSEVKTVSATDSVFLVAVGDVMLSRNVGQKMLENKSYYYPFLKMMDYLKSGDLVFGNLETAIMPGKIVKTGEMNFRSDTSTAPVLKEIGFSVVSLANNHTPNYGTKGLLDTFKYLDASGIKYVGAGKDDKRAYEPIYLEKNGLTFAFIAQNDYDVVPKNYVASLNHPGTALFNQEELIKSIKEAKTKADFVIFSMHSGTEYIPMPNEKQKQFAYLAIDNGADVVIGHHPHVVQTMEKYKDKYIFYSLGNFVFDQMWSEDTRQGLAIKLEFKKDVGVESVSLLPLEIYNYSQPQVAVGTTSQIILKRLQYPIDEQEVRTIW